jgi:uncharacterized protein involved in oxidation of intracellular sulfur
MIVVMAVDDGVCGEVLVSDTTVVMVGDVRGIGMPVRKRRRHRARLDRQAHEQHQAQTCQRVAIVAQPSAPVKDAAGSGRRAYHATQRNQPVPRTLFILNDPPYGTERAYNALRIAGALSKRDDEEVQVFLMGDAASCARRGQKVPQGYYNIEVMLHQVGRHGSAIAVCGTCMDARGLTEADLTEMTRRSSLDELATWIQAANRTLVF